ncbi:MAG TPA: bifunctional UDP-N-acetylglucosamine diphosphorylase/glucosamine-1-phosphate N-acetyltransferase GlmU [Terracidiphilus sp.]|nr:bifunctional UDP-N-acetylglucosamine diphosphorylase/glucosamine-1-phosphate N-acetyltransferase GlmU [Terracidiphilus sp.]
MSEKRAGSQANTSSLAVVIMAAGKGTRLKSRRPKVLHQVGGRALLGHVIAAASRVIDPKDIFVVIGHEADRVRAAVGDTGTNFIDQTEQRGTGHAIQSALPAVRGYQNVLVLSGDVPLIRTETIEQLWKFHQAEKAAMTVLTATPEDPTGYGRIVRKSSASADVDAIVEQSSLRPDQQSLPEINTGIYAFKTGALQQHLAQLKADNAKAELYLTDMAGLLRSAGERVVAVQAESAAEVLGANTIAELVELDATMRIAAAHRLMAAGVTIYRPETCVIDAEVEVAADAILEPFVQLLGKTRIGANTTIRSYSVLENCSVGERVVIRQSCVLADSSIADGSDIGPFARLRPGCEIGQNVHIGNFVEVKKSKLHAGVKAGHLAYLGDSEIGEKTNIGAGVITCNYDGAQKHKTTIGKETFIGSDSTLVAPVTIEDGAYVGAGSCITKNVPAGALAVGRARQVVKEGWAQARRARQKPSEHS